MVKTFYFNTGVTPQNGTPDNPIPLMEGQIWRGGTKQIPFQCEDVPDGAVFKFASPYPDVQGHENYIVREILEGSAMMSKYAYFSK